LSDFIAEFLDALTAAGFTPKDGKVIADDKWNDAYCEGDKRNNPHGTYTLKIVDESFAIGCFMDRRDQDKKFKWHSKSAVKLSPEERRERKRRLEQYEKEKQEAEDKKHLRLALLLTKAYKKLPKFEKETYPENSYLERKGIDPHGIKFRAKGNELIVPVYGADGRVYTIQRINDRGGKYLFLGGRKKGGYFPFVKKGESFETILLCEGFATGATIRQATGLPVAAAIDSGNLIYALHTLKGKFPNSKFVICADNDAWTFQASKKPKTLNTAEIPPEDPRWDEWREAGMLWNVGIDKARAAAAKCGGASVIAPNFEGLSIVKKPTDFNDLAALAGEEAVRLQIMAAVNSIPARGEAAEGMDASRDPDQQPLGGEYFPPDQGYVEPDYPPTPPEVEDIKIRETGFLGLSFRCLGHNNGTYYYFSFKERRVVSLLASNHSMPMLIQLADLDEWSAYAKTETNPKKIALYAQNAMMNECQRIGVYRPEDAVRGAGAWIDDGHIVVNCGKQLFVDGKVIPFQSFKSEYTYVETAPLLRPDQTTPLTNSEAIILKTACEMVTWENPLSASLLAGWLVIAPVCGALEYTKGMEYRPHIWITGESESGKSTVIRRLAKVILGKIGVFMEGGTTEASIREIMGNDARPLILDEAEASEQAMAGIIALARKATTGGTVGKYGQGQCRVRFAACFSSINTSVSKTADESRISMLRIRKNKSKTAIQDYDKLSRLLDDNINEEFSRRLIARTIENMSTLLANIKTFQRAARNVIKSARASEQIGTMIAGFYLLHSTNQISEEAAEEWIRRYKWGDHTMIESKSESEKCLQHISSAIVRFTSSSGISYDRSIGELIMDASEKNSDEDKFLRRYGIARVGQFVYFAVRHEILQRVLRGTDWYDSYSARLLNLEGAERHNQSFYFASGIRTNAVIVPLRHFTENNQKDMLEPQKQVDYDSMEEVSLD